MTQTSNAYLTEVAGGKNIRPVHILSLMNDVDDLYKGGLGPITPPLNTKLLANLVPQSGYYVVGTFTADGYVLPERKQAAWNASAPGFPDTAVGGSTTSTTEVLILNKAFMLPPTGACSLSNIEGLFKIVASSSGTPTAYVTKYDVVVSKVSAAGTETVLATVTKTSSASGAVPYPNSITLSEAFSLAVSGASFAATDRIVLRLKVYGRSSSGVAITLTLNHQAAPFWVLLTF